MSSMKRWECVVAILASRWQIPLAICAVIVGGAALYRMRPPRQSVPFEALLADVLTLAEHGAYHDAADAAANLLEQDPPLPREQRARLHNALADIIFRQEMIRGIPNRTNARLLLEHHEAAIACGLRSDARLALRAARAHEWLGEAEAAINAYRSVLSRQPASDARRSALQGLVRLLDGRPAAEEERRGYIQALLDEQGVALGYLWWALQYGVREALDHGDAEQARELLTHHGQRFQRSDLKGYYDYLWAWVHTHEGATELAGPLLDRAEQWLDKQGRADPDLDQAGFLPAMCRWLRGRLDLAEGRPQAALARFDEALSLQSHGDLLVDLTDGRAEALARLERHEAAASAVRETLARLQGNPAELNVARPRLRQTVLQLAGARGDARDHENTIRYLELAAKLTPQADAEAQLDLLEQTARTYAEGASDMSDAQNQRRWHLAAGEVYERAAELAQLDEPRYASLLWESATQYELAERLADARRMLTSFATGRSLDPRMPQALLRLGQACASDGQYQDAIEHYRRLIETYPVLEESSRARVQSAACLMALGEAHYAEARSIFESLLQDEHVAPEAQVFRDALLGLCELLYQQREHADGISRMEDFLVFYPQDPETFHVRFMLADAYRRSAYELLENAKAGATASRERVSHERFQRAAELFEDFGQQVDRMPGEDRARQIYKRLALFYRGDCLFELNEPATLTKALATYRQAAALYQGEPAALVAEVQIANVYLRQGKLVEAARAVERARWLLGSIPDGVFAEYDDDMGREAWDHYLSLARSSHLFGAVLTEAP
jgi:tetratricopeptide (TPR) repeat protein